MRGLLAALFLFTVASSASAGNRSPLAGRMGTMPDAAVQRLDIRIIGIEFGAHSALTFAALMSHVVAAS
ncbi:MAG: hypothetical protein GZ089_11515 [Aromatoleum sp.]|nr:hypothetical protein [Aromatoleum sp.]